MLDLSTAQQDQQSPYTGRVARVEPPSVAEAFRATMDANDRVDGFAAEFRNQSDYLQSRADDFTAKTGTSLPKLQFSDGSSAADLDRTWNDYLGNLRGVMTAESQKRNDPTLMPPSDPDIVLGGINYARSAQAKQAELGRAPFGPGMLLGRTAASGVGMATDPANLISLTALAIAPEGAPLLAATLRTGGAMGGQQLVSDVAHYGYRQQVDPSYGVGDVAGDVLEAGVSGALFGAGETLGGQGMRRTIGAAVGGAVGGAALGGMADGPQGALEGAVGGAALPVMGAGFQGLGMSWRALKARSPDFAARMPLDVRDAGEIAEKAGDLQAQKPNWPGTSGDAAHAAAIGAAEETLVNGKPFILPAAAEAEAATRRGQVFYPGGSIDARYGLAEHGDLVTSHDADFNTRPDYPPELQPRDRSGAPAQDQVNQIASNLEPDRLGPSPEANSGAPIVGPDGVVESGNGRVLAVGQAYERGRGEAYRSWLEQQGYDTTGFDKPVLVGMRETPLDDTARADFAHAANGSASLRMSATEQALSDARHLDSGTVDLAKTSDLSAATNRDFARAFVAKLPQGERGGMLTRDGGLSANGVRRAQAAMAARAYGDPAFLSRALDHPDPNIKAIAGALSDAAGPWARMRDAATRGDIEPGHDITRDMLQAVHAIMRARDEGRPAWEMLNQGDIFQSDTTQLASRMFFRDEAMRQPAGRARVADALRAYAEEAGKNTTGGRLFDDAVEPTDVLRKLLQKIAPEASDDFVLASMRKAESEDWLANALNKLIADAKSESELTPPKMEKSLEDQLRELIGKSEEPKQETRPAAPGEQTIRAGHISYGDEAPANAIDTSDLDYGGEGAHEFGGVQHYYDLDFVRDGDMLHAVVSNITHENEKGETVRSADDLTAVQFYKLKKEILDGLKGGTLDEQAEQLSEIERYNRLTPEQQRAEDTAHQETQERARIDAEITKNREIVAAVDAALADGWRPEANRFNSFNWNTAPEGVKQFASPKSIEKVSAALRSRGFLPKSADPAFSLRSPERLAGALDQAAHDAAALGRDDPAARARTEAASEPAAEAQPDLTLRNPTTGAETQAQAVASLKDAMRQFDVSRNADVDILTRASAMAIGDRLGKLVGDMKVYTVGPAEMRALAEGRIKMQSGFEPAGFFDPKSGHIAVLDDAMRDPREAASLLIHEGLHGAFMQTINESEAARNVIDHLRIMAASVHFERGGEAADHYGLTNAHEFVSEGFSNPEFQHFLASIPADDRMVQAFGLDKAPGYSLWDVFVGAVRKILGLAPDQHTLLDATLRLGDLLEQRRAELSRETGSDIAPMMRPIEADAPARTPEEEASRAKQFADVKDAISYRINSDRIAQHPNGPLAGFLGILTRDIHEKGGINVESIQQDYEGRMALATEHILEPYGSKFAGLKQDVAGMRDVIGEIFGVDTKNETAKTAAHAWLAGVDKFATDEAKRLGKVFTAAEDWRLPQFWESRRAQKFGKTVLLSDMEREIEAGGLKVFDPDTHEEANPLRQRAILDGAADKIVTDASLGGTPGASGSFRTDMRVFRFTDGEAGRDAYLRLMDKYGAGRGGYLSMMQAHVGKVSRELGLARVLGPGWAEVGEKLKDDALLADRVNRANQGPRDMAQRLRDLPKDTGKFLTGWLESPTKAEAVWQHMSGQASGVGSELMAGLLSETRAFMTATRMGSALVTAVPADTVNWLMAAKHNGMDMGRMVSEVSKAFVKDSPERREEAARLGIVAHAGADAALGTKRFEDQFVGEKLMKRMADFIIRSQGLHAWDSAIKRAFPMEMLGTIAQRAGTAFDKLDEPFANFLDRFGLKNDWAELSNPDHMLDTGDAKFLHPDKLPEPLRVKLMSAIYDERQFAYLAGGSERVRAISSQAKAGTLPGELARSVFLFKSFPMSMLATWGMRAARETGAGRIGTLATLVTGMTFAGALAMQARSVLQGKDPRSMKDPFFWGESFLQGGAAGIYGDFFKEAFSRSDTSLTETMMGPLSAIPAGIQGLTSGARRVAESGEKVNFGSKLARIISQNTPGGNLWYARLLASRLVFDNIQRMIDKDYAGSFARQQQRALKTNHQGFFWAPGQNAPGRAPDLGAMVQ